MSLDCNFGRTQKEASLNDQIGRRLLMEAADLMCGNQEPESFPPANTLREGQAVFDRAGNLRRARCVGGASINIDYVDGAVSTITAPNFTLTRLANGDYQTSSRLPDGTVRTQTNRGPVSVRMGPLAPGLENQGEFVHVRINDLTGMSTLFRPAPER